MFYKIMLILNYIPSLLDILVKMEYSYFVMSYIVNLTSEIILFYLLHILFADK